MREQLKQYVELLFAGAADCEDVKQEILQNTLDRYDDLIAEGKVPEAAYRLAISGIGDINEILGTARTVAPAPSISQETEDTPAKKRMRAIAVGLYILCPVPVLILGTLSGDNDFLAVIGVVGLLAMVAVATVLMVLGAVKEEEDQEAPVPEALRGVFKVISAVALVLFFVLGFLTQAWHCTWLVFPIAGAVKKLIRAIYDYKEEHAQ